MKAKKLIAFRIPEILHEKLKTRAATENKNRTYWQGTATVSSVILKILQDALKDPEPVPAKKTTTKRR